MIKKLLANVTGFADGLEMGNNTKVSLKDLKPQKSSQPPLSFVVGFLNLYMCV